MASRYGVARGPHVVAPGDPGDAPTMKVWIDQDLCTGDGLCEEICPSVFTLLDDGLAYVKQDGVALSSPGGSAGLATVAPDMEDAVVEASEECPGECIFIAKDQFVVLTSRRDEVKNPV